MEISWPTLVLGVGAIVASVNLFIFRKPLAKLLAPIAEVGLSKTSQDAELRALRSNIISAIGGMVIGILIIAISIFHGRAQQESGQSVSPSGNLFIVICGVALILVVGPISIRQYFAAMNKYKDQNKGEGGSEF